MQFKVLSRNDAIKYAQETTKNSILISISDKKESSPIEFLFLTKNNLHIQDVALLHFDDEEAPHENAMKLEDAYRIIHFVNDNINKNIDEIIVHCGAGISRSAGVAAGLMKILTANDDAIFNNPRFCPNATCYKLMLSAFYGSYDIDEIDKKFKHSLEIWLKEQDL